MITDRRIRCVSWDRNVFSATNALFWTSRGWDGSEAMVEVSSEQRLSLPESTWVPVFSSDMLKTLVITLQGCQATYTIASSLVGDDERSMSKMNSLALDTIFFPLAVMGLLRLFSAFWLTSDYAYAETPDNAAFEMRRRSVETGGTDGDATLLGDWNVTPTCCTPVRFRKVTFWASILFRVVFLLLTMGLSAVPLLFLTLVPSMSAGTVTFSITLFTLVLFYLVLFVATATILAYHFFRGCTSTVLPCIESLWYRAYSAVILGLILALFTVACIETRKTPCGSYTSFSGTDGDVMACQTSRTSLIALSPGMNSPRAGFGLATTWPTSPRGNTNESILGAGEYWVRNFTGACLGAFDEGWSMAQIVQGGNVTNVTALYLGTMS